MGSESSPFFIVLSFGFYLINFQVHASTPQSNVSSDYINSLSLQRSFPIKEDRAIIILDKKVQEPDIKEILNNHPGLEIGFIYEEVFHGFSCNRSTGSHRATEKNVREREDFSFLSI